MKAATTIRVHGWAPCELYQSWESARDETALALEAWRHAPLGSRRDAFAVYRAAADREDAAAHAWLQSCEAYDAASSLRTKEHR